MYEAFFGLHEPAFSLNPDPRFLWLSETHQEGLSAVCYGISRHKGFLMLTGEVGTGKTTLLRAALDRVPADFLDIPEAAIVTNTAELGPLDLLKLVCAELRIGSPQPGSPPPTKADYVIALNAFLMDRQRAGLTTVLVIDEAQNLSLTTLEQVRLLSNLETRSEKLLQIVLIGQPELRKKLSDPRLRQLRQRIAVAHHLEPLSPPEVLPYLRHRIEVAGGRYERIFAGGAETAFLEFSSGCPRLVNLLADKVLLSAYARSMRPVVPALVELKAKELAAWCFRPPAESGAGRE
jgi:general secretion pathway protein A